MLLGRQVPKRDLKAFVERKGERPLVAAARAMDPVDEGQGLLAFERRPDFACKNPDNFGQRRERHEEGLDKSQPSVAGLVDQLQGGHIRLIGAHLAVADDAVTSELEARKLERRNPHTDRLSSRF